MFVLPKPKILQVYSPRTYQVITVNAVASLFTILSKAKAVAIHFQAFTLFTIAVYHFVIILLLGCSLSTNQTCLHLYKDMSLSVIHHNIKRTQYQNNYLKSKQWIDRAGRAYISGHYWFRWGEMIQ